MTSNDLPVLVGLGDVDDGVAEVDWAAREAHARGTGLRILRAYHVAETVLPWDSTIDRTIRSDVLHNAQRRLATATERVTTNWPDVEVQGQAVEGIAAEVLCVAAERAAVTVLGSRRYGALGSALLGSVSTAVAGAAPGPVVVAANRAGDPAEDPPVVVGIDGSDASEDVLDFAFGYASRHHRRLHAIFCWHPDLLASMQWRLPPPAPEKAERWLAESLAGWQEKYPDVRTVRAVIRDFPVSGLVAQSLAGELVVVGSRSRHPHVAALLGSVSQGVLHHATCPVAIVHPQDRSRHPVV